MNFKSFMTFNSLILVIFGLGFILMPATMIATYGGQLSPLGLQIAQLLGAAFLGFGILRWTARNEKSSVLLSSLVLAALVEDAIGFVIVLKAQLAGLTNSLGWSNVLLYGFFALGYGYFHFKKD